MNSGEDKEDINPPTELYAYHATSSFANDTALPYLSYFAVRLGASFEQIAWMTSMMNLIPNALQYFWGYFFGIYQALRYPLLTWCPLLQKLPC
jgi:hypothetical protein